MWLNYKMPATELYCGIFNCKLFSLLHRNKRSRSYICLGNFASLKIKYEFDETNLYTKIQHFVYRSRRPKLEGKTQIDGETEKMK
jgi:hypothetical protein